MELTTPLSRIAGIGPTFAKRLQSLGLFTVEDLIYHYPFRYDDFSKISAISEAKIGEVVTVKGEIWAIKNTYTRFRKVLTLATLNDGQGTIELIWFNQPWLIKNIKTGDRIQVSGKVDRKGYKTTLVAPRWEKIEMEGIPKEIIHTGRLVPIYPETYGLTSKWIRDKIAKILPLAVLKINDPLPSNFQKTMLSLVEALTQIHFPENSQLMYRAKHRLSFDELFFIQLDNQKIKQQWQKKELSIPLQIEQTSLNNFIQSLPFKLTPAQKKVIEEIAQDLQKPHPMNRLIQGDVGSGKTIVAATIIYLTHLNRLRSVVMAPTEILAFQHYETLTKFLSPFDLKVGIYTGSKKFNPNSLPNVIVGTHAVLSEKLNLDQVGLVVVDEQQRFGVEQRSILRKKAKSPHFLTMTATPIPRTVALTLYGDLDLSIIDEMPVGRKVVRTHFVPQKKRADAYKFIADHIKKREQVYIITPLIDESETLISAKAAKAEFEILSKKIFPQFKLGLLHGRLKSKEKEAVIADFKEQKINILVSTSVVEVGMDIPNATIMVIEGAERFGLAQLHQLRGRVGRGIEQSYTFLFAGQEDPSSVNRLKNLEKIYDGLKLAELDLKIRGSGEVFGIRQSGQWNLKIASLTDLDLITQTREAARKILVESPDLDKYPLLKAKLDSGDRNISPD